MRIQLAVLPGPTIGGYVQLTKHDLRTIRHDRAEENRTYAQRFIGQTEYELQPPLVLFGAALRQFPRLLLEENLIALMEHGHYVDNAQMEVAAPVV